MSLTDFLSILRQRWLVVVLCMLVAAGVVFAITPAERDLSPRIGSYTATATMLVGSTGTDTTGGGYASLGRVALFITTGEVPKNAAAALGHTGDPALLAKQLTVETASDSASVTITTTASDGERAANVVNTFANEAIAFFETSPPGAESARLSFLQEATPIPNESTANFVIPPDRWFRTALAAVLGLLFGIALALILERLDSRLRNREDVAEALDLPIVGIVPKMDAGQKRSKEIVAVTEPLSPYADGYRSVRAALLHGQAEAQAASPRAEQSLVVLITSPHMAEGKSTSSANLAASFAETGKKVLVIDADLRSPDVHEKLDVPQGMGVSDLLEEGRGSLATVVRPTNIPNVEVITAGTKLSNPTALASRMRPLLTAARKRADVVIIDSAPMLEAAEVFDILPHVDDVVLVVRHGRLTAAAAQRTKEMLSRFNIPVVGAVIIAAPVRKGDPGYGGGYGYGYGEGKKSKNPSKRGKTKASSSRARVEEPEGVTPQRSA